MRTPEGKVKDAVKAFLKERGAYFFMPVQTGYGSPCLDFIGFYKGKGFAIETKRKGGRITPRQKYTADEMVRAGAAVWVVDDSADLKYLELWFR